MTSPSTRVAGPVPGPAPVAGGLRLHMEVVELQRIAPSGTILGTYEVETDEHGNILSFRRFRRYTRGEASRA